MKTKNIVKVANRKIDAFGKKVGMNYFERKKLVKTVNNFAYDTGVNVASTLIVDGISRAAYITGVVLGATANSACKLAGKAVKAVKTGSSNTVNSIKAKKAMMTAKKLADDLYEEEIEEDVAMEDEAFEEDAEGIAEA